MEKFGTHSTFNGSFKNSYSVPVDAAYAFGLLFIICGIAAFAFNAAILFVLFCRRRSLFSHVFYIMIFNFALIDLLKSLCSIVWALKLLPVGVTSSMFFMKIDQLVLMVLRFSNLATILNLLMITLNEYLFIVYPLRYRQIVTRCRVIALLVICWLAAWTFTVSILLLGSREQSIYIKPDCLARRAVETNMTGKPLPSSCYVRSGTSLDSQFVYNVGIIFFCFMCLVISIVCYTALIRVISRIVKSDAEMMNANEYKICAENGEQKRTHKQLLKRNKYVIVIGSVIMIYTVYLISYSAIQILYVSRLARMLSFMRASISRKSMYYARWIFQSLICLHSLLQPLCYFRMREFRTMFKGIMCRWCRKEMQFSENIFLSMSENVFHRRSTQPLLH
ncbi:hypothetical protein Tcan_13679 [Toxocara canis]|uniref:G-protein coupled receptors family 1 profile domain-containing protein n=1 Tax=Toxocara canis TaxID=6265 RepID=A0A0B2V7V3_TOXCA|nr:hypothetical protein Tcan_13679 [Toxocara canis]